MSDSSFFKVCDEAPWGDYGHTLFHGSVEGSPHHLRNPTAELELARVGPFVPAVTVPWGAVILTKDAAIGFEDQAFSGIELRPCKLIKIVKIDIEHWDWSAEEPEKYPAGGEPENYIERRKHSADAASALPPLFWIAASETFSYPPSRLIEDLRASPPSVDAFRVTLDLFVSPRLRDWLAGRCGDFASFQAVEELANRTT